MFQSHRKFELLGSKRTIALAVIRTSKFREECYSSTKNLWIYLCFFSFSFSSNSLFRSLSPCYADLWLSLSAAVTGSTQQKQNHTHEKNISKITYQKLAKSNHAPAADCNGSGRLTDSRSPFPIFSLLVSTGNVDLKTQINLLDCCDFGRKCVVHFLGLMGCTYPRSPIIHFEQWIKRWVFSRHSFLLFLALSWSVRHYQRWRISIKLQNRSMNS